MPLSVVLPTYQSAHTLDACLVACSRALPSGGEILVVDDASTDETAAVCARHDVRRLVHENNRGTSAARNTGWRAARHPLVAFVDADVVLAPDALTRLCAAVEADPDAAGANGIYDLARHPGFVTDFVNLSIHFQHLSHGPRVASAFTGLCLLRRSALEAMDGWDEAFGSRYADDVNTRFLLPAGCIHLVSAARGHHLKQLDLTGILDHRFPIGWFYVRALRHHRKAGRTLAPKAVLSYRYPANTLFAALLLPGLLVGLGWVPVLGLLAANLPFAVFVARHRGPLAAAAAVLLSALEGFAFLIGMGASVVALAARPAPAAEAT